MVARPQIEATTGISDSDHLFVLGGDGPLIRAQTAVYKQGGVDPIFLPRSAGSWPGYVFTDDPLHLAAGHFGLGHGSGAHAPDEYYVIDCSNPKVQGMDGAVNSFVAYLYELAAIGS